VADEVSLASQNDGSMFPVLFSALELALVAVIDCGLCFLLLHKFLTLLNGLDYIAAMVASTIVCGASMV
jgi:hypothetical protein